MSTDRCPFNFSVLHLSALPILYCVGTSVPNKLRYIAERRNLLALNVHACIFVLFSFFIINLSNRQCYIFLHTMGGGLNTASRRENSYSFFPLHFVSRCISRPAALKKNPNSSDTSDTHRFPWYTRHSSTSGNWRHDKPWFTGLPA
jgi:hypothetical protein